MRDAETRVESLGDRFEAEADEARADALLDRLVRARANRDKAERELQSAQAEADAVRAAIDGDALHGALRSLTETLSAGPSAEVATFNRRLRDHFDGLGIDPNGGPPVPLWKVQVPTQSSSPHPLASRVELPCTPRRGVEPAPDHNPAGLPGSSIRRRHGRLIRAAQSPQSIWPAGTPTWRAYSSASARRD